jgi:hypothetical protein
MPLRNSAAVDARVLHAGWWARVAASLIDTAIGLVAFTVLFGTAAALDAAGAPTAAFLPSASAGCSPST